VLQDDKKKEREDDKKKERDRPEPPAGNWRDGAQPVKPREVLLFTALIEP